MDCLEGQTVLRWGVIEFLSDALQWFVVTILVPVLALAVLAGVSLVFVWVVRKIGSRQKQSFEEWNRETRQYSSGTQAPDDE